MLPQNGLGESEAPDQVPGILRQKPPWWCMTLAALQRFSPVSRA